MTTKQVTPEEVVELKPQDKQANKTSEPNRRNSRTSRDAGYSMLLVTSVMAVTSICRLVTPAEAGGKGKGGRQGHIIIQNELKGQSVPIYMPIPIPVPVPVSTGQSVDHHRHHHQRDNDPDDEVKKIYLIQLAQPQPPNLKGGFSGPAQSNRYHRQAPVHTSGYHYNHQPQAIKAAPAADVKILPIVMIPPVAPVPPIHAAAEAPVNTRMTLSPHFNNYLVQPARSKSFERDSRGHMIVDTFSEYGGSLGGSVFRERFSGRSRPNSFRGRMGRVSMQRQLSPLDEESSAAAHIRSRQQLAREPDYDDYDQTNADQRARFTLLPASNSASASGITRQRIKPVVWLERRRNQLPVSLNSINDIIDVYNRQQVANELELGGLSQSPAEFSSAQLRLTRVHQRPRRLGTDPIDVPANGDSRREPLASNMETSLDELASINREIRQQLRARASHNDLSPLYYDRGDRLHSRHSGSQSDNESDPYEMDDWRFDSIKSVAHTAAASNDTLPLVDKTQNSTLATAPSRLPASN